MLVPFCSASNRNISEGDVVKTTGRVVEVPVGDAMLGRVVNALGQPIDGKGPIDTNAFRQIERVAHGVIDQKDQSIHRYRQELRRLMP